PNISYSTGTMTAPPPMPNTPASSPVTIPAASTAAASTISSSAGTLPSPDLPARFAGRRRPMLACAPLRNQRREDAMAVVETEEHGQILVVRMTRPERLNALNLDMRTALAETWTAFRHSDRFEVAIFTGTGRGFCAGEDMRESLARGTPGGSRPAIED